MISLRECSVRRAFMEYQFKKYGVKKWNFHLVDRWTEIKDNFNVIARYGWCINEAFGHTIAQLQSLAHWYTTTTEEHAIFADDDFSLEPVDYWNFTWSEFVEALPEDWECIQLLRVENDFSNERQIAHPQYYQLRTVRGRWWGTASLMKRNYVKKILDRHVLGYNTFKLDLLDEYPDQITDWVVEIVENVLFLYKGVVYNIPMVVDALNNESTYGGSSDDRELYYKSRDMVLNLWKEHGKTLSVYDLTRV